MEVKSKKYKKVINEDNGEEEFEVTTVYEQTEVTTESINDCENLKAYYEAEISKINTKISDLSKL